jgi:xylan 1,4-beta-xylosidase
VQSNGAQPLSNILREGVVDAPDINAMATRRPQELDVLVWNYHDDDVATDPAAIRLRIEDLPEQKMRVEQFRMDPDHSNAYAVWRKMGSPEQPTTTQQAQLEKGGMLEAMEPPELQMNDSMPHTGTLEFTLPRQGVALFRLHW